MTPFDPITDREMTVILREVSDHYRERIERLEAALKVLAESDNYDRTVFVKAPDGALITPWQFAEEALRGEPKC
jgi:hypothetical protein